MKDKKKLPKKAEKKNLPAPADETAVDAETDRYLRAQAVIEAINANLPDSQHLPPIPKDYVFRTRDAKVVDISMAAAFENIGGVSRLIDTAHRDPKWFYELWLKSAGRNDKGSNSAATINIISAIPETPQDAIEIGQNGKAIVPDALDADFEDWDD